MSTTMSIHELSAILTACAGGDLAALEEDVSDVSFEDLGYDSLALIETTAVIKRDYGVDIPDNEVSEARTPSELLDKINDRIGV